MLHFQKEFIWNSCICKFVFFKFHRMWKFFKKYLKIGHSIMQFACKYVMSYTNLFTIFPYGIWCFTGNDVTFIFVCSIKIICISLQQNLFVYLYVNRGFSNRAKNKDIENKRIYVFKIANEQGCILFCFHTFFL